MKTYRYRRWDGTQSAFDLEADAALEAVSELMMHGLSLAEAMEWMRRYGLEGASFRITSLDEMARELRAELDALGAEFHLDDATQELGDAFEQLLDDEAAALLDAHGHESRAMNDFLSRRHREGALAERLAAFADYSWQSAAAREAYEEIAERRDDIDALEAFRAERGEQFRGPHAADFEQALELMGRARTIERLVQALATGALDGIDPDALRELLGDGAARSFIWLRDLAQVLERAGYVTSDGSEPKLTPRAIRRIGAYALADVYGRLRKGRPGEHDVDARGADSPLPDVTRPYQFGDALQLDTVQTILNAIRRTAHTRRSTSSIELTIDDLTVREREATTETTTVLLLDLSWSMSFEGRFAAAKRVALALSHRVATAYPRDRFFVVGFSTDARELSPRELAEVAWDLGEPFTNLQAGFETAERLIARHPSRSPQILVVTDGQPTAYRADGRLHAEWPMGPGGVSPRAVSETMKAVRRLTKRAVTINTFMLDDAPELVGFVERMTEVNRGRAFFTAPERLGSFLTLDYVDRKR